MEECERTISQHTCPSYYVHWHCNLTPWSGVLIIWMIVYWGMQGVPLFMVARYCGNSWYPGVEGLSIGVGLSKPGTFFPEPRSGV